MDSSCDASRESDHVQSWEALSARPFGISGYVSPLRTQCLALEALENFSASGDRPRDDAIAPLRGDKLAQVQATRGLNACSWAASHTDLGSNAQESP